LISLFKSPEYKGLTEKVAAMLVQMPATFR